MVSKPNVDCIHTDKTPSKFSRKSVALLKLKVHVFGPLCALWYYTVNDRYSGDRFSGNDGFSGRKLPDAAILFTVSGITVLVEVLF